MTRPTSDGAPAAALLAMLLLGLLALAERAGLPLPFVQAFLCVAALLTYGALAAFSRTARERAFLGLDNGIGRGANSLGAGLALAAATWLLCEAIAPPMNSAAWLAAMLGATLGISAAHAIARIAERGADGEAEPTGATGLVTAFAATAAGAALLVVALHAAQAEVARLFGLGDVAALAVAALLALTPTLLGGGRGAIAIAGAMATAATLAILLLVGLGLATLGPLPLPGQSESRTLDAIAEARGHWGIVSPLQPTAWPDPANLLERGALLAFGAAFATAAALSLAAAPAAPIRRRGVAASAAVALALWPVLTTAIAGYAVEAAAVRFVGAPAARPPPALVESSAFGLVRVCGVEADSAEGLRRACRVAPRDPTAIDRSWIELRPAFLRSGLPAALGLPSTLSLAASGLQLAIALAGAALGLWIVARAVGRGMLGRRRQAAGLASLRQGLIRLAALAASAAASAAVVFGFLPPRESVLVLAAAAAFIAAARFWAMRQRAPGIPVAELVEAKPASRRRRADSSHPAIGDPT